MKLELIRNICISYRDEILEQISGAEGRYDAQNPLLYDLTDAESV